MGVCPKKGDTCKYNQVWEAKTAGKNRSVREQKRPVYTYFSTALIQLYVMLGKQHLTQQHRMTPCSPSLFTSEFNVILCVDFFLSSFLCQSFIFWTAGGGR